MNKAQYQQYRRSIRDNGWRYTVHVCANESHMRDILKLVQLQAAEDLLVMRANWMRRPDTSAANIIGLTSFILPSA